MQTTFTRSFLALLLMAVPCLAIEAGTYAISCETINRDNQTYLRRGYILIVSADGAGQLMAPNHNLTDRNGGGEDSSPKITSLNENRGFAISARFKDGESNGDPSKGVIKSDCLLNLSFDEQGFGGGSEVTQHGCEVIRARINKIPNVEQAGRGDSDKPSN
jgi:hypothetical protein